MSIYFLAEAISSQQSAEIASVAEIRRNTLSKTPSKNTRAYRKKFLSMPKT